MSDKIFHFKQFAVDQTNCGMKVNTDGVLLGALTQADQPLTILDIGTGTGVIALMLAQRFPEAQIDAVEIDVKAAQTARANFQKSSFAKRLTVYPMSFEKYLEINPDKKFDLIVTNPPFFIDSLKSAAVNKQFARHTNKHFFERLIKGAAGLLKPDGIISIILPVTTAELIKDIANINGLYAQKLVCIHSFSYSKMHRVLISFGFEIKRLRKKSFIIYDQPQEYSDQYKRLLRDFFTIF